MRGLLFFAAVYGAAASLGVLGVGAPFRAAGSWIDRRLFPKRWSEDLSENEQGGPLRMFVHCPACLSFWIGLVLTFWLLPLSGWTLNEIVTRVVYALAATGVSWAVHVTLTKLGQYQV